MSNPPFNVDKVKAEAAQNAGRLPFGLPGVNKAGEIGNANYLWISYFYAYPAGLVLSWLPPQRTARARTRISARN